MVFFEWFEFKEKLLPWLNLIMFDVKLLDPKQHLKYTGQKNNIILENLAELIKERPENVIPRIPLIPDITATTENLKAISKLYKDLNIKRCALLPYNPTGFSKAENIGKKVSSILSRHMMKPEEIIRCKEIFSWAELVEF